MIGIQFSINAKGHKVIEPKDITRKRLGYSLDILDAVCLAVNYEAGTSNYLPQSIHVVRDDDIVDRMTVHRARRDGVIAKNWVSPRDRYDPGCSDRQAFKPEYGGGFQCSH